MPKMLFRILLIVSCASLVATQADAAQWELLFPLLFGPPTDYSRTTSVQPTSDGGYVVAGSTRSPADVSDTWVLKLDADGNILWQKTYGGGGYASSASAVQVTADGGYVVAGSTSSPGGVSDAWVLKLDASGNVLWQKTYGGALDNEAYGIQATADGGYVLVGRWDYSCGSVSTCGGKAALLKLDASGNILWQKTYGGLKEALSAVQPTADGGYVVAGTTDPNGAGGGDAWVLKLDAGGNILWQKTYGGGGYDRAAAVQATADGGYVVAGSTTSFGAGGSDAWVLKLDASGNVLWQRTYGGVLADVAYAVQATADGGYVVAGQWDFSHTCNNCFSGQAGLLKLDAGGNVAWQKAYGLADLASMQPTADGGYVVAGPQRLFYWGPSSGAVLKLDANGAIAGCDAMRTLSARSADSSATAQDGTAAVGDMSISPISFLPTVWDTTVVAQQQCYDPWPASRLTAVEYYHGAYGHYFVTTLPEEIAALDSGRFSGWARTGLSFQVYGLDPGAASVCRFWSGQTFAPKSSHFYTPYLPECAYLKQQGVWQYEGDVFALAMPIGPAGQGACATATQPLYRAYNNGQGGAPNHRYTIDPAVLDAMIAQGWIMEGEASTRVFACVPAPE